MAELMVDRYAEALLDQTDRLAAMLNAADLGRRVPSCPEWDLRQLVATLVRHTASEQISWRGG